MRTFMPVSGRRPWGSSRWMVILAEIYGNEKKAGNDKRRNIRWIKI